MCGMEMGSREEPNPSSPKLPKPSQSTENECAPQSTTYITSRLQPILLPDFSWEPAICFPCFWAAEQC